MGVIGFLVRLLLILQMLLISECIYEENITIDNGGGACGM